MIIYQHIEIFISANNIWMIFLSCLCIWFIFIISWLYLIIVDITVNEVLYNIFPKYSLVENFLNVWEEIILIYSISNAIWSEEGNNGLSFKEYILLCKSFNKWYFTNERSQRRLFEDWNEEDSIKEATSRTRRLIPRMTIFWDPSVRATISHTLLDFQTHQASTSGWSLPQYKIHS